jgi:hypothetical protein
MFWVAEVRKRKMSLVKMRNHTLLPLSREMAMTGLN